MDRPPDSDAEIETTERLGACFDRIAARPELGAFHSGETTANSPGMVRQVPRRTAVLTRILTGTVQLGSVLDPKLDFIWRRLLGSYRPKCSFDFFDPTGRFAARLHTIRPIRL